MTPRRPLASALLLALTLGAASAAPAQWPPEVKNLEVLPEDTDARVLIDIMKGFTAALGVRCTYCHVGEEGQPLATFDFASDEKEHKRRARIMMQMTQAINADHIPRLGEEEAVRVKCMTCHRGQEEPELIEDVLVEAARSGGSAAALTRYEELREEYYGSHTFDFSEGALVKTAEILAIGGQAEEAIALLERNLEHFPDSQRTLATLGEVQARSGATDAAIATFERLLEMDPENAFAKQRLEQLQTKTAGE